MSTHRRPPSTPLPQPRLADTASAAAAQILRRKLDPHRIASYGEIREYHTRRRWWLRRAMLVLTIFLAAGPVNHGLYEAFVRHKVVKASPVVDRMIECAGLPLRCTYGLACWTESRPLIAMMQGVVAALEGIDHTCDYAVQVSLGKRTLPRAPSEWLLIGLSLALLAAYSLSPGPVWWVFRLCAIELMAAVYSMMEFLYAPLVWLVDRSRTAREFYEEYYDVMEWID